MLEEFPHLERAPITEALIDIRVDLPSSVDLDTLQSFHDDIRDDYPERRKRVKWIGQLQFKGGEVPTMQSPSGGPDGFLFTSPDGRQVVQARLDGFTFSRLKDYKNWDHLRDEAKILWKRYAEIATPLQINRIAVRYINRMVFPPPLSELKRWIQTRPEIASALPQNPAGFLMKVVLPFTSHAATAIINQTIDSDNDGQPALILDIDVFSKETIAVDHPQLWGRFEDLRRVKNEVFFQSVTKEAVELFR